MKIKKLPAFYLAAIIAASSSYNITAAETSIFDQIMDTIQNIYLKFNAVTDESVSNNKTVSDNNISQNDSFENKLNALMPKDKNYMFSPLSIKMALALAAEGSDGNTKNEILNILGEKDFNELENKITRLCNDYSRISAFDLNIANAVFLNTDRVNSSLSDEFKKNTETKLNSESLTVEESNAVNTVNSWVSRKTNDKIKTLINDSDFDAILANAIYFKANWKKQFNESNTKKDDFTQRDGNKKETEFMYNSSRYNYYKDSDVEMVALDYVTEVDDISMYIAITGDKKIDFNKYINKLTTKRGSVKIPKFKSSYSDSLKNTLETLGMTKAFDASQADFSKILEDPDANLFISDVIHKTYIDVSEKGTEAAAATGVIALTTAANPNSESPFEFVADKPFSYIIKDNTNDEIIFMGEYAFIE